MERRKVLIADDEDGVRYVVRNMLGKEYIVIEAEDGETAVDIAKTQSPDLILMDIMMPKLDGVGACNILKSDSCTKEIPVIMLTARKHRLDQEYAEGMGADGYITKPFRQRDLLDIINRYLPTS